MYSKNSGEEVQLNIWDTAGQEQYRSISTLYFRDSNIAIICFNYEDKKSMDDIDEWVGFIKSASPECILYLVSTKEDLNDGSGAVETFLKDKKSTIFAKTFKTSAKTGFGIEDIFLSAANEEFYSINTENTDSFELYKTEDSSKNCC